MRIRSQIQDDRTFEHSKSFLEGEVSGDLQLDEYEVIYRQLSAEVIEDGIIPAAVRELSGSELVVVGRIDDIAPSEDIRAVRFDGPRGFIVTFEKTDPLFALDLADP